MQPAPHIWVPKRNPLWYPGTPLRGAHGSPLPFNLDDVAGKPLEPHEYAKLLAEIQCLGLGKGLFLGAQRQQSGSSTPYSPLDEGNGVTWFDMQDAASFTNSGGFVSAITNKVSSVSWTEATNRPAYAATGLNSKPCMDADGTNDRIISAEAAVYTNLVTQHAYTLMMAIQADDLDAIEVIYSVANSGAAGPGSKRWGTDTGGAGRWTIAATDDASTGYLLNSSVANPTVTDPVVLEYFSPGSTASLRTNGAAADPSAGATAYGALSPNNSALFCRPSSTPASFFDGRLGELLQFTVELADAARSRIRSYMGARWAITVA